MLHKGDEVTINTPGESEHRATGVVVDYLSQWNVIVRTPSGYEWNYGEHELERKASADV